MIGPKKLSTIREQLRGALAATGDDPIDWLEKRIATPDQIGRKGALASNSRGGYAASMSTVQEIEDAIRNLPSEDLAALRAWFSEFDAASWDRQFEEDVAAGRLDDLAEEALRDWREGRCTDL